MNSYSYSLPFHATKANIHFSFQLLIRSTCIIYVKDVVEEQEEILNLYNLHLYNADKKKSHTGILIVSKWGNKP